MADVPTFQVRPPLRCCRTLSDSDRLVCGTIANWERAGAVAGGSSFYCDEHRGPNDRPIAGELVFQRVSVMAEVIFAGVSPMPSMSKAEAVAQVESALERVGGLLNVIQVTCQIGRHAPPPSPAKRAGGRPRVG